MAKQRNQIEQAADALRGLQQQAEPAAQHRQEAAPVEPAATDPLAELASAATQKPASPRPLHITIKRFGEFGKTKEPKTRKPAKQPKPKKVRQPPPPPPVLTPLQKLQRTRQIELRRTVIPVLMSMSLAMLVLGGWSAGVLVMNKDYFHRGAAATINTVHLAQLALLAWPIAVILLIGTGFLIYEVHSWFVMYPPEPKKPVQLPSATNK